MMTCTSALETATAGPHRLLRACCIHVHSRLVDTWRNRQTPVWLASSISASKRDAFHNFTVLLCQGVLVTQGQDPGTLHPQHTMITGSGGRPSCQSWQLSCKCECQCLGLTLLVVPERCGATFCSVTTQSSRRPYLDLDAQTSLPKGCPRNASGPESFVTCH